MTKEENLRMSFSIPSKLVGYPQSKNHPYQPEINNLTERMNQAVLAMLRTVPEKYKTLLKDHGSKVLHLRLTAQNTEVHGFLSGYLMFCCKPRLSIDIILQNEVDTPCDTHKQYLENWKEVMEDACVTALQNSTCRKEHDKERKLQAGQWLGKLEQGDKILVRNLTTRGGPGKPRSY